MSVGLLQSMEWRHVRRGDTWEGRPMGATTSEVLHDMNFNLASVYEWGGASDNFLLALAGNQTAFGGPPPPRPYEEAGVD